MMWLPSPGKERAQTHDVSCAPPRSMTSNDKVEFTYTGVPFSVFLMVLCELRIGTDGFTTALLSVLGRGVWLFG